MRDKKQTVKHEKKISRELGWGTTVVSRLRSVEIKLVLAMISKVNEAEKRLQASD